MATGEATVFDADEMLPDLAAPDPLFARPFGDLRARARWFRQVVLTDAGSAAVEAQLRHAGADDLFDAVLSAAGPERHEPAPEAYASAADKLHVHLGEVRLGAAHGWDVSAALAAGARAAFVARSGWALAPHAPPPDVAGGGPIAAAGRIAREDG